MKISTSAFKNGDILPEEQVLNAHGCTGGNISPDLKWEDIPSGAKEFALIVHDPDAPVENGWYHWIVLNIPLSVNEFEKGVQIKAPMVETGTSFSDVEGYGGACPPRGHGVHRYNFKIYALNRVLPPEVAKLPPREIEKAVEAAAIDFAVVTALYQR